MKPSGPDAKDVGECLISKFLTNSLTDEEKSTWEIKEIDKKVKHNFPIVSVVD